MAGSLLDRGIISADGSCHHSSGVSILMSHCRSSRVSDSWCATGSLQMTKNMAEQISQLQIYQAFLPDSTEEKFSFNHPKKYSTSHHDIFFLIKKKNKKHFFPHINPRKHRWKLSDTSPAHLNKNSYQTRIDESQRCLTSKYR